MLDEYIKKQPIITKLLINSINNNRIVQAYLFVSNDKSFLMDYSLAFSKRLINSSNNENINKQIDNNDYPELKIINPINNIIKKEELSSLQKEFSVKSTLGDRLVYIINGADKLNSSSANTILKFLEEPSDDIVAILLTDNLSKVLPTIKSRCQVLLLNNDSNENYIDILYKKYKDYKDEEYSYDYFINDLRNIINTIELFERLNINVFTHYKSDIFDFYKSKEDLCLLFDFMLYFYYEVLNYKLDKNKITGVIFIDNINEIANNNEIEVIQRKLVLIQEIINKLETNMNLKLLMDEFIIKYSEVK
ncbi:MAG: hypothetical protein IJH20_06115 [Bacilli bacterium]|nr:hypothetical protein [Bacilli bacterium]